MANYLREVNDFNDIDGSIIITEGVGKEKDYFIEGIFMQGDIVNRNGRIYPMEILENATQRYIRENVLKDTAVGELAHPESIGINHERISHKIVGLRAEGTNIIGRAKVTTALPMGQIVKGLIDEGIKFGVSSRALGSLNETSQGKFVKDDLFLITAADVVSDPSAPEAWVTAIMEGKEWIFENGLIIEQESSVKNLINKTSKGGLTEEKLLFLFDKTIEMLLSK